MSAESKIAKQMGEEFCRLASVWFFYMHLLDMSLRELIIACMAAQATVSCELSRTGGGVLCGTLVYTRKGGLQALYECAKWHHDVRMNHITFLNFENALRLRSVLPVSVDVFPGRIAARKCQAMMWTAGNLCKSRMVGCHASVFFSVWGGLRISMYFCFFWNGCRFPLFCWCYLIFLSLRFALADSISAGNVLFSAVLRFRLEVRGEWDAPRRWLGIALLFGQPPVNSASRA